MKRFKKNIKISHQNPDSHLKNKLKKINSRILAAILFVIIFASIGACVLIVSRAAGTATLALSPSSGSVTLGSTITLTITENSGTDVVNAVQADLTYDQTKLQFVSIDTTTGAFNLIAKSEGGNGTVNFSGATSTPVTGSKTVAIVKFTAIGVGTTNISFASSSAIIRSSDTSNVLGTTTGSSYTITDNIAPSVPSGITMTAHTISTITFTWAASSDNIGVTGYKIYRGGTQIGTSSTNSFTDTSLSPNTNYSYTVAAYDAAGNTSAQSTAASIATDTDKTAPSAPASITSSSQTTTTISISWTGSTDNVGVTGYKIYRNGTQVGTSTITSYTDSNLSSGTNYSYTVAAYDAAGNTSAQSTAASFGTKAQAGDVNGDGHVNVTDLSILATNYGSSSSTRAMGDLNNDGVVNVYDLSILASNWGV